MNNVGLGPRLCKRLLKGRERTVRCWAHQQLTAMHIESEHHFFKDFHKVRQLLLPFSLRPAITVPS
jgi:hypothetical protein